MWISAVLISPAAGFFGLLAVVLAGSIILAGVSAIFQGLKAIITLITGLLPGGGRGSFFMTLADALMSLLVLVFSTVFLALFLSVIQALFRDSDNPPKTFMIVDILLLVGIVIYLRNKKRIQGAARGLANLMAKNPGGGSTRLPDPGNPVNVLGGAARGIQMAADLRRLTSRGKNRNSGTEQPQAQPEGSAPSTGKELVPVASGGDHTPTQTSPATQRTQQARRVMGTVADVGLHVGGAVASGGTSTLATAAAAAAKARKARQIAATANTARKAITGPPDQRQQALDTLSQQALASGARKALPAGGKGLPAAPSGPQGLPAAPDGPKGLPAAPGGSKGLPPGPGSSKGMPRARRAALPPAPNPSKEPSKPTGPSSPGRSEGQQPSSRPGPAPAPSPAQGPVAGTSKGMPRAPRATLPPAPNPGGKPSKPTGPNSPGKSEQLQPASRPEPAPPALGPVAGTSIPTQPINVVRARLRDQVERVVTPDGVVVLVNKPAR